MSALEQRLKEHYASNAYVADMKGYGLSGGMRSGGRVRNMQPLGTREMMPSDMDRYEGYGLSGGDGNYYDNVMNAVRMVDKSSFPMPGYRLGQVQGQGLSGGMYSGGCPMCGSAFSGGGLSGGRQKNQRRVEAGKSSAWLTRVKNYSVSNNVSMKDAMKALKGTCNRKLLETKEKLKDCRNRL